MIGRLLRRGRQREFQPIPSTRKEKGEKVDDARLGKAKCLPKRQSLESSFVQSTDRSFKSDEQKGLLED